MKKNSPALIFVVYKHISGHIITKEVFCTHQPKQKKFPKLFSLISKVYKTFYKLRWESVLSYSLSTETIKHGKTKTTEVQKKENKPYIFIKGSIRNLPPRTSNSGKALKEHNTPCSSWGGGAGGSCFPKKASPNCSEDSTFSDGEACTHVAGGRPLQTSIFRAWPLPSTCTKSPSAYRLDRLSTELWACVPPR